MLSKVVGLLVAFVLPLVVICVLFRVLSPIPFFLLLCFPVTFCIAAFNSKSVTKITLLDDSVLIEKSNYFGKITTQEISLQKITVTYQETYLSSLHGNSGVIYNLIFKDGKTRLASITGSEVKLNGGMARTKQDIDTIAEDLRTVGIDIIQGPVLTPSMRKNLARKSMVLSAIWALVWIVRVLSHGVFFDKVGCSLAGNARSCARLGAAYHKSSPAQSAEYHLKACNAGIADSCLYVGTQYHTGNGVEKSPTKAAELMSKACEGGISSSCAQLGSFYFYGNGVEKSFEKAAEFYQKSCTGGNHTGCYSLGILYRDGSGVAKSPAKSAEFYQKSCDLGNAQACENLGIAYQHGNGVEKSFATANVLYRKACDLGDGGGCAYVGGMYEFGNGVEKSMDMAKPFYQKACDKGVQSGCSKLK